MNVKNAAPALGEPLGIEFGNTRYAVRGEVREGLASPALLASWLQDHPIPRADQAVPALTPDDLPRFVALRDAIRALARHAADGTEPAAGPLAVVNDAAALAPGWPHLSWRSGAAERTAAPPVDAVLAAIAGSAVEVFGGPLRDAVRACGGPGCVLFFVKRHPRREWCSPGCGNRARVGRHYARHRGHG
ncbi:CGNR zinc finger domain-containing protein [Actinomadura macrotermitis]|uniref:Zinc finger CGNR domain-containing protein n=1 Tax=Actinomadura macrotermitis TaxID=2585200 RepID=A0A7K0BSK6_9ACTN|nr:hypothetical protein [Actinomadura macrotermitis]